MTRTQIARRGLIAAMAAGAMAPSSAMATHWSCDGFNQPTCNVKYVQQHTVNPTLDKLDPAVEIVAGAIELAGELAADVLCRYFGAC